MASGRKKTKSGKQRSFANKKGPRKGIFRWIIAGVFLALVLVFFTGNRSLTKLISLKNQQQELAKERQQLLDENKELNEEIEKLKKDDKYLEKIAREKYNMKKKGEDIYQVDPE